MKKWTHNHKFLDDQCIVCGLSAQEIHKKDLESGKYCRKWGHTWNMGGTCVSCGAERGLQSPTTRLRNLDDDDIPTTKGDESPRGFWGNKTTGYTTDKENE